MADYLIFLIQWLHVLFAIYLIGSGFFFEFFVKPQLASNLEPQDTGKITMAIGKKFTLLVHIAFLITIVSGLYRAFIVQKLDFSALYNSPYGLILGIKMGVVAIAYIIAIIITKTAIDIEKAELSSRPPLVNRMGFLAKTNTLLGVIIVFLAVGLRNIQYLV
jgi:uncharacterized membrane protein